jgi:putative ATP-binding cassette transporter
MSFFIDKLRRTGRFLRQVTHLSLPFFLSDQRWRALSMLVAIIAFNLGSVYMSVVFNDWYRVFYDALQAKNEPSFWQLLIRFSWLAAIAIVIGLCQYFFTSVLVLRWRAWMTRDLMGRWLTNQTFYQLELGRYAGQSDLSTTESGLPEQGQRVPDNPDQRLQEDISQFTSQTISLTMGFLNAVVTLGSFVGILWGLSGSFPIYGVVIPGFMVWMAVLYCTIGTVLTHFIGRPLIGINFEQQKCEADFRHYLVRVREYSEAIALDKGSTVEGKRLDGRFGAVLAITMKLIIRKTKLNSFTSLFGQAAVVFPFIIAAPRFFSGGLQLGGLMQVSNAFGRVQDSLSWFIDTYSSLASWRATTERLTSFEAALPARAVKQPKTISLIKEPKEPQPELQPLSASELSIAGLTLKLPNGATLMQDVTLNVEPGQHTLIQGPSGSGKSTLLRAIAGIWPWAKGSVKLPDSAMIIPQRPYFPDGPLRDALAYPQDARSYSDEQLHAALEAAQLPHLQSRLDAFDTWGQKLSGGELQRLAIARVLLKRPAWVLADEATSALDTPTEHVLMDKLKELTEKLGGALISISHRPALEDLNKQEWVFKRNSEGTDTPAPSKAAWHIDSLALS